MANKIKDTDYLAISARVRAMETTLLTAERMERLLEARSDEEVSKLLQDCGYPELDAARPEAMDAALSQAREELLTDLGDGAPDPRYIDIFKLKYDYHNAKAILKAAAMGTSPDRMLMDMGRIGAAELKTARGKRRTGQTARCSAGSCGGGQVRTGYHPGPPTQRHRAGPLDVPGHGPSSRGYRQPVPSGICGDPDRCRQSPGADPDAADGKKRRFSGGRSL